MAHFQFAVSGQVLDLLTPSRGISDTLDVNSAEFEFRSHEWDGTQKWAHFSNPDYNDGESQDYQLIGDEISRGRGLNLTPGIWDVYITGHRIMNDEEVERYVTESQSIIIVQSGVQDESPLGKMIPSTAEQINAKASEAYANRITSATVTVGGNTGTPEASVVITGEYGTKSLDFSFDNLKSNGIESFEIDETEENSGRITVVLTDGTVTTYDGLKDALADFNEMSEEAGEAEVIREENEAARVEAEDARATEFASWGDIQYYAEAYAVGTRQGEGVPSTDPAYNNNAKYYAETTAGIFSTVTEYAAAASGSADNASRSAGAASASELAAASSESNAEAWAVGERNGTPVGSSDTTYHNNSKYYSEEASASATAAADGEAWAVGQRGGVDVETTDPTYHNNSKYYSQTADSYATAAATSAATAADGEAWAVGQRGGVDVETTDPTYENNAKYYAELSRALTSSVRNYVDGQDSEMLVFEYFIPSEGD